MLQYIWRAPRVNKVDWSWHFRQRQQAEEKPSPGSSNACLYGTITGLYNTLLITLSVKVENSEKTDWISIPKHEDPSTGSRLWLGRLR